MVFETGQLTKGLAGLVSGGFHQNAIYRATLAHFMLRQELNFVKSSGGIAADGGQVVHLRIDHYPLSRTYLEQVPHDHG